jgi:hypothetical protein
VAIFREVFFEGYVTKEAYDVCNVINALAVVGFILIVNHQCRIMQCLKLK